MILHRRTLLANKGGGGAPHRSKPKPVLRVATPTLFDLLKWKTDEQNTAALKFCTIVSYKNHPLRGYCWLISRCLQKGLEEVSTKVSGLGFSRMLGVRDLICFFGTACGWVRK